MRILTFIGSLICFASTAQTVLIDEDFSAGIPANYILINDQLSPVHTEYNNAWIHVQNNDDIDHEDVASSTSYFSPIGRANRWMIVPNLQLGAYGNILSWDMKSKDPSFLESIKVLLSKTGTEKADFVDTLYINDMVEPDWKTIEMNIALKGFVSQTVHIAFVLQTVDGFKFLLDNLKVEKESTLKTESLEPKSFAFANPFKNYIQIKTDEVIKHISLINLSGQIVASGNQKNMATDHLTQGIYILEIETENGIFKSKVIKE